MSELESHIRSGRVTLTEGSVYELLRRDERIVFDPHVAHAGLIYDDRSRALLAAVHTTYIDIARRAGLPMIAFADTWRASSERVNASVFRGRAVNRDNVEFLRTLANDSPGKVFVGGLTGPRGDAYRPDDAPEGATALRYHAGQIDELAAAGVDVLIAATLPALREAKAIAQLMSATAVPWMLSFVVRPNGQLLDATPLANAIAALDDTASRPPLGYSINCVHPDVARLALSTLPDALLKRVIAFQGNTSALSPEELDGLDHVDSADPDQFSRAMAELGSVSNICVIGGCCGTDERHLESLANRSAGFKART